MHYKTHYIILQGTKSEVQSEMNSLSDQGYIFIGNLNTFEVSADDPDGSTQIIHSLIMQKMIPLEENQKNHG
jgi:hypothetical protein